MASITSAKQATMLQLQYAAESIGLKRTYLMPAAQSVGTNVPLAEDGASAGNDTTTSEEKHQGPDIKWHPSYHTHLNRVQKLSPLRVGRPKTVPDGFPELIQSPRVWSGSEFRNTDQYILRFTEAEITEIDAALAYFKSLPGDNGPEEVNQKTFPLPVLAKKMEDVAINLHHGTGFTVLRGLEPKRYSPLDNVLLYLGITSYIAEVRGLQDYDGRMLVHIQDVEQNLPEATGRPSPYTSRAQPFHTDRCDILVYALDVAAIGGESLLASYHRKGRTEFEAQKKVRQVTCTPHNTSSGKIYNESAETRPDILHTLAEDNWTFDEFVTPASWHHRPLLYQFGEHGPRFIYSRRPLTGAPFSPHVVGVPAMTEVQAEALDTVHFTAEKHQLEVKIQRGDIEIFNNMAIFHARKGFVDDDSHKRHFVRLWLKNKKLAWKRPAALETQGRELYGPLDTKIVARWDISKAPSVPRVVARHMSCS